MSTTTRLFPAAFALALLVGRAPAWAEVEFKPYGPDKPPASQRNGPSAEQQLQAERLRSADLERQLREAKAAKTDRPESKGENNPQVQAKAKQDAVVPVAVAPDEVVWGWPTTSTVMSAFSEVRKGVDFSGKEGEPVFSAGDGKVEYVGTGLRGYGELIIIKHNATFRSAYAHNRKILVREGNAVIRGQKIAEMGNTDTDSVKLHFEIRKQGNPVDPAQYLPKK